MRRAAPCPTGSCSSAKAAQASLVAPQLANATGHATNGIPRGLQRRQLSLATAKFFDRFTHDLGFRAPCSSRLLVQPARNLGRDLQSEQAHRSESVILACQGDNTLPSLSS